MEPLTPALIAVATLILTKAFEKTGEKLGEAVSSQAAQLMQLIQRKALPRTAAIEQAAQPVDVGQAVLEVWLAKQERYEIAERIRSRWAIALHQCAGSVDVIGFRKDGLLIGSQF
ncbi:hypothetical protein K9N68_18265 [Kovacikia minuta CCNUW1]|uniref:hypothetical protein n=1 Tax=Kovacikia minuta TaxID=2931930 RepID=UPI001CCBA790|nr:hypothetical protein [Kovacikia minuta]UBF23714.1 hypothetical protein K9N68_18265 [Kovacikia minuta CCNUW1]